MSRDAAAHRTALAPASTFKTLFIGHPSGIPPKRQPARDQSEFFLSLVLAISTNRSGI